MNQWMKTRLYELQSNYEMDYILTHNNVVKTWSEGKYAFVLWHAHGNPFGSGNFIFVDDCSKLNDEYPSIIAAASCSNSDTDYLNIGQAMMKQGAVGFLGANKAAYYCSGWNNPSDGSDQSFKYFFSSAVTSENYTQGQALQYAIREMYSRGLWGSLKYETFVHGSLWGNPNLGIKPIFINNPPEKPAAPTGSANGRTNKEYYFSCSTIDTEDDTVYYCWSWGDNSYEWFGPYDSGEECSISHFWKDNGNFEIKVMARDINGGESEWSDPLPISIIKSKQYITSFHFILNKLNSIIPDIVEKLLN
jgi:hypothetical protein